MTLNHSVSSPMNDNIDLATPKRWYPAHILHCRQDIIEDRLAPASRLRIEKLISRSDSPWIGYFLRILYVQAERYRRLLVANRPASRDVYKKHKDIFTAVLCRDERGACAMLSSHSRYNLKLCQDFSGR